MFHIAIVDDEQAHRDILTKYIEEWARKEHLDAAVKHFPGSEAFYFEWCANQSYDVLFLDIMLDGTDGVSLAKNLREQGAAIMIIFATGIVDYMQEGYEVEAIHYLLKPLDKEKVWECLGKCLGRKEDSHEMILLPTEDGLMKAEAGRIIYAEATGHYCMLESMDGRFFVKTGIRELAQKLEGCGDFMFSHRSYLVNVRRISKTGKQDLVMDNGALVPVSRRLYREINGRFIQIFAGTV